MINDGADNQEVVSLLWNFPVGEKFRASSKMEIKKR